MGRPSALEEQLNTSPKSAQDDSTVIEITPAAPAKQQHGRWLRTAQVYWRNVRARPLFMLLPPVLTFCVLCSLSVMGVALGADKFEADTRSRAESAALDWAASFRLSHEKVFTPLVTLSILIQQNPELASVKKSFPKVAEQLLMSVNGNRTVIQELQVSPMGIIQMIAPNNSETAARLGINIFQQPALRSGALDTIKRQKIVMNGPLKLVQGNFGTISRIPIFIEDVPANETFGNNITEPTNCPPGLCYNETAQEKFWGFATSIGPLDDLRAGNDSRLDLLKQKGYKWLMTRPYTASERNDIKLYTPEWTDRHGDYVFSASSNWPSAKAVASNISIANAVWQVYLEPELGWRPEWEQGVMAAVVLGCLLMSLLVGIIMASWAEQKRLLGDVLDSNKQLEQTTGKLQEEKLRLDALLVRQYNLIAVLGKPRTRGCKSTNGTHSPDDSTGDAPEGLTLDRIENMRRQLAVNSNTSAQDMESIQTVDLLGEGTFGKVYKGLWRGSVVAVKTMLLPANMSGAEKREKMAVMEAAISSSLSHPNIVQTYTYTIRPMRDSQQPQSSSSDNRVDTVGEHTTTGSGGSSNVHSYEVRLVLEYCDKGCLRNALDDGVFILESGGLNYLAVLDTAADVAKAMLHLHSLNVLHSDLKARNVMLSTGNTDGRGIVGKVGDFGLSLKMDCHETHISQVFQGTLSHMAPEILLDGRVSKAADVYAFGITLWELYTGRRAFEGIPRALLGHQITKEGLRPRFPVGAPHGYQALAEACWQSDWEMRPTFAEILKQLLGMRAADPAPTPPLHINLHARGPSMGSTGTASNGADSRGRLAAVTGSAGTAGGDAAPLIIIGSTASQNLTEQDVSYYLDHSNSDLGWSRGASGRSASAPQITRYRPAPMPQIAESADELVGEAGPQHQQPRVLSEVLPRAPQVQQQQDDGGRGPLSDAELLEQCEMQLAVQQQQLQDGLKPAAMLKQQPLEQQQEQELHSGVQSVPLPTPDASREAPIRPHVTAADAASDAAAAAAWGSGPEGVQPAAKAGPSRPSKGPAAAAGAAAGEAGQQHPMLQFLASEGGTGTDFSSFEGTGPQGQGNAVAQ